MDTSWLEEGLVDAGFTYELECLPMFQYRIVLSWKGTRCFDVIRSSRQAALRAAYYRFVAPEQDKLAKLCLADRLEVQRIRSEMLA